MTKYIVEAESIEEAEKKDGEYLGYVDQDDDTDGETFGPFKTHEELHANHSSYVEGR